MTRAEKVAEAQRLRTEGLTYREIAERLGAAISTVEEWVNDPNLAKKKARHRRYGGACIDCGAATYGGRGIGRAPKRCEPCDRIRNEARNARIFEAWNNGEKAKAIAEREDMSEAAVTTLTHHYRQRHGLPLSLHRRRNREPWPLIEQRWHEGATGREIASEAGTTPSNISDMIQAMRRVGVDLPYRVKVKAR